MKDLTLPKEATIHQAMITLDRTAEKVLLIVDDDGKLIGTLTDGDLRRYILKGHDLKGNISKAYNPNPRYFYQNKYRMVQIRSLLKEKKIELVPIVNEEHVVVDFINWETAFGVLEKEEKEKVKVNAPVVIMAGGKGTRLEPFTSVLPKPLVPVNGIPIIEHIINNFCKYNEGEFYITVHHMSLIMKAYFEEKKGDYTITFLNEEKPLGTASSLKLLESQIDAPMFVSNCDIIIKADYSKLYSFHCKEGHDITLVASLKSYNIPYGTCELNEEGHLHHILEKPEFNFLVNTGLYVVNPSVMDLIPENTLFHMTHLIEKVKENGGKIGVYPVGEDAWIDVGQWAEYKRAMKIFENFK